MENQNPQHVRTLRELYPHLDADQLIEIENNLEQYVAFTLRLYERICGDPEAYAEFKALTASHPTPTMSVERSKRTNFISSE